MTSEMGLVLRGSQYMELSVQIPGRFQENQEESLYLSKKSSSTLILGLQGPPVFPQSSQDSNFIGFHFVQYSNRDRSIYQIPCHLLMGFLAGLSIKDENLLLLVNSNKPVELITTTTPPSTNPNRTGITFFFKFGCKGVQNMLLLQNMALWHIDYSELKVLKSVDARKTLWSFFLFLKVGDKIPM